MSEHDENGNPHYAVDQRVEFRASGPHHRVGTGWIQSVNPIKTRAGAIEPVYVVRIYFMDGQVIEPTAEHAADKTAKPAHIVLGEPEIIRAFPADAE